ncbi:MAG: hydrogenase maturation nickel metallochaperone HypA [Oscillospiraceae bacterium]|nr:hydrogenase maturation nickel metallochaperone HypA [Oscillospiraceae bacterium]
MHELGTIYYVIDTVEKLVKENNLKQVGSVTLEVGEVSGIIPKYLTDFWDYAREKTGFLRETELKIETIEAVTYCENCGKTYPTMKYAKICPHCGSDQTYLLYGNEYNIKEIEAC